MAGWIAAFGGHCSLRRCASWALYEMPGIGTAKYIILMHYLPFTETIQLLAATACNREATISPQSGAESPGSRVGLGPPKMQARALGPPKPTIRLGSGRA